MDVQFSPSVFSAASTVNAVNSGYDPSQSDFIAALTQFQQCLAAIYNDPSAGNYSNLTSAAQALYNAYSELQAGGSDDQKMANDFLNAGDPNGGFGYVIRVMNDSMNGNGTDLTFCEYELASFSGYYNAAQGGINAFFAKYPPN